MNATEVHFVGVAPSVFLVTAARCHASELRRAFPHVLTIDVVIAIDPADRGWDTTAAGYRLIHVRLELHQPSGDVVIDGEQGPARRRHADAYAALREVFAAGQRQLAVSIPLADARSG